MMHFKVAFVLLTLAVLFVQAKPSHPFGFHGVFDHLDLAPPVLPAVPFHAGDPAADPAAVFPYHHHAKLLPPPAHFHSNALLPFAAPLLPAPANILPASAPLLPALAPLLPAPAHFIPAPAPLLPAPEPFIPAPTHLLHAPAPLIPAPEHFIPAPTHVIHAPAPLLPAPAHFLPAPASLLPAPAHFHPAPAPLLPAPAPLLPAPVVHTETHVVPAATPLSTPVWDTLPIVDPIPTYRAIPGPKTTTHHVSVGYAFPQSRLARLHTSVHGVPQAHLHAAPLVLGHQHRHHHHHTLF